MNKRYSWRYFIVLNDKEQFGNIVEGAEVFDDGLPLCVDFNIAISFKSPEELNDWVKKNTSLSVENGDYHIEGHYLSDDFYE